MKSGGNRLGLRHRKVERAGFDAIERSEIRVEHHHPFAADDMDPRLDPRGDRHGRHIAVIGPPLLG